MNHTQQGYNRNVKIRQNFIPINQSIINQDNLSFQLRVLNQSINHLVNEPNEKMTTHLFKARIQPLIDRRHIPRTNTSVIFCGDIDSNFGELRGGIPWVLGPGIFQVDRLSLATLRVELLRARRRLNVRKNSPFIVLCETIQTKRKLKNKLVSEFEKISPQFERRHDDTQSSWYDHGSRRETASDWAAQIPPDFVSTCFYDRMPLT